MRKQWSYRSKASLFMSLGPNCGFTTPQLTAIHTHTVEWKHVKVGRQTACKLLQKWAWKLDLREILSIDPLISRLLIKVITLTFIREPFTSRLDNRRPPAGGPQSSSPTLCSTRRCIERLIGDPTIHGCWAKSPVGKGRPNECDHSLLKWRIKLVFLARWIAGRCPFPGHFLAHLRHLYSTRIAFAWERVTVRRSSGRSRKSWKWLSRSTKRGWTFEIDY